MIIPHSNRKKLFPKYKGLVIVSSNTEVSNRDSASGVQKKIKRDIPRHEQQNENNLPSQSKQSVLLK